MSDDSEIIPLFPLNTVLLPGIALPLYIFEDRYKLMISTCLSTTGRFGVVLIATGSEVGGPAVPYQVGTTARIVGVEQLAGGRMNIVTLGERRFRIIEPIGGMPYQRARVVYWPDEPGGCDLAELAAQVRGALDRFLSAGSAEATDVISRLPGDPADLANVIAASLPIDLAERQALLEAPGTCARLRRIVEILVDEAAMLRATGAVRFITSRPAPFSPN